MLLNWRSLPRGLLSWWGCSLRRTRSLRSCWGLSSDRSRLLSLNRLLLDFLDSLLRMHFLLGRLLPWRRASSRSLWSFGRSRSLLSSRNRLDWRSCLLLSGVENLGFFLLHLVVISLLSFRVC